MTSPVRHRDHAARAELPVHAKNILAAANAVVSRNTGRVPKNLWSDAGDGPPIVGYVADSEHDEAAFVAEEVDRLTDEGEATPARWPCSTGPTRSLHVPSRKSSSAAGLPYKVVGGVRFYERREVRDLLGLPAADRERGRRGVAAAGCSTCLRRGIGERAEACVAALARRRPGQLRGRAGPA